MSIAEEIRKIVAESPQLEYEPERWMCHPRLFYEAVKRGIITPDGNATKGHHVMEVFFIEIPKT